MQAANLIASLMQTCCQSNNQAVLSMLFELPALQHAGEDA